jgi:hypothetical protein
MFSGLPNFTHWITVEHTKLKSPSKCHAVSRSFSSVMFYITLTYYVSKMIHESPDESPLSSFPPPKQTKVMELIPAP